MEQLETNITTSVASAIDQGIEFDILFIWGTLPVPKEDKPVAKANNIPTHFKSTFFPVFIFAAEFYAELKLINV